MCSPGKFRCQIEHPDVERAARLRKTREHAIRRARELTKRIRYEVDRFSGMKLIDPLDVIENIERLIHAIGPVR